MAGKFLIFSLYRFEASPSAVHLLIRTELPNYRNGSQLEENEAYAAEARQRQQLLQAFEQDHQVKQPIFLGELAGFPSADILYDKHGNFEISLFYQPTVCGFPYLLIDAAETLEQYAELVAQNKDFQQPDPCDDAVHLNAFLMVQP